ncbi:hypothetical protein [Candidatus Terasakiella magnetica]|nr:hypothetical protein [Candidatus Terasakiella magnetica]
MGGWMLACASMTGEMVAPFTLPNRQENPTLLSSQPYGEVKE